MSGDFSRRRFDHRKRFSGVLMQQGRVHVDAEWNELVEILDRRSRAEAVDLVARVAVSRQTPDAFKIERDGGGNLTIRRGRIYVDGLLAENHGDLVMAAIPRFDPVLEEIYGGDRLPYNVQPDLPSAPNVEVPCAIYLDVWQREVTSIEDPSLIEPALGVDTTARTKTVWQVKYAKLGGDKTCAEAALDPAYVNKTARSGGRLSTQTYTVSPDSDPCGIKPGTGYRGLDNRLYRVEIHTGGALGAATFKWSRDNGSVATRVRSATTTVLIVDSVGRDRDLRFNPGDWIEVTDDQTELAGLPGQLRQVKEQERTDDVFHTIRLETPLTGFTVANGAVAVTTNMRVRRWNHVSTTGDIQIPAGGTPVKLENGVEVVFFVDPQTGSGFKTGDYWVFAARTGKPIEKQETAPPRGVHHHYALLAVVNAAGAVTNCPQLWPETAPAAQAPVNTPAQTPVPAESCCTRVCKPNDDVQQAVTQVGNAGGGCVCLKPGVHKLKQPLVIMASNITLHGEAPGASTLSIDGGGPLIIIGNAKNPAIANIDVHDIAFEGKTSDSDFDCIMIEAASRVHIRDCTFHIESKADPADTYHRGVALYAGADDVTIAGNRFDNTTIGCSAVGAGGLLFADNIVKAGTIGKQAAGASTGFIGVVVMSSNHGPCRVEGNAIEGYQTGVLLDSTVQDAIVSGNTFLRSGEVLDNDGPWFAIDAAGPRAFVSENTVELALSGHAGIRVAGAFSQVVSNRINNTSGGGAPLGILVARSASGPYADLKVALPELPPDYCVVEANTLAGSTIKVTEDKPLHVEGTRVIGNLTGNRTPLTHADGLKLVQTDKAIVSGNVFRNWSIGIRTEGGIANHVSGNVITNGSEGIDVSDDQGALIESNDVDTMMRYGIFATDVTSLTLRGNRIASSGIGGGDPADDLVGVYVLHATGRLTIESCEIIHSGGDASGKATTEGQEVWGVRIYDVQDCHVANNQVIGVTVDKPDPAFKHQGISIKTTSTASVEMVANTVSGVGVPHLVEVTSIDGKSRLTGAIFSSNRAEHRQALGSKKNPKDKTGEEFATVLLNARQLSVVGNQIKADAAGCPSFDFGLSSRLAGVGNVTSGLWVRLPADIRPPQVEQANVIGE